MMFLDYSSCDYTRYLQGWRFWTGLLSCENICACWRDSALSVTLGLSRSTTHLNFLPNNRLVGLTVMVDCEVSLCFNKNLANFCHFLHSILTVCSARPLLVGWYDVDVVYFNLIGLHKLREFRNQKVRSITLWHSESRKTSLEHWTVVVEVVDNIRESLAILNGHQLWWNTYVLERDPSNQCAVYA